MREAGVWEWAYYQEQAGADIRPAVEQALQEWAGATGVLMVNSAKGNLQIASGGNAFIYGTGSRPGCGFGAVACLPRYGQDMLIVYDSASMAPWSLRSQTAVGLHELGHALSDLGEQYRHTGGQIYCTGKDWTIMDCGLGHALFIQPFDIENFQNFNFPKVRSGGTIVESGSSVMFWYGPSDSRTTRKAIYFQTYTGYTFWSGQTAAPCFVDAIVCGGVQVQGIGPCTGVLVDDQNAIAGSWGRNLTPVGWTRCQ